MEVRDGFIISVFNYCDRWCERCPFTGRCHVFADGAEHEFECDQGPLTQPMAERQEAELIKHAERWKKWGIDFDEIMEEVDRSIAAGEELAPEEVLLEDLELETRAKEYGYALMKWCSDESHPPQSQAAREAIEVITHDSILVPSKICRALMGRADRTMEEVNDPTSDGNGSAKVALLGLARSRIAWTALVASGEVTSDFARTFVSEIDFFVQQLDLKFPKARAFVRPGFDEPEAIKRLQARELTGDEPENLWNP